MPGPTELAIILVIVLIVFGAGRLPQVFEALGEGMKRFRDAQREGEEEGAHDITPPPPKPKELPKGQPEAEVTEAEEVPAEQSKAE